MVTPARARVRYRCVDGYRCFEVDSFYVLFFVLLMDRRKMINSILYVEVKGVYCIDIRHLRARYFGMFYYWSKLLKRRVVRGILHLYLRSPINRTLYLEPSVL